MDEGLGGSRTCPYVGKQGVSCEGSSGEREDVSRLVEDVFEYGQYWNRGGKPTTDRPTDAPSEAREEGRGEYISRSLTQLLLLPLATLARPPTRLSRPNSSVSMPPVLQPRQDHFRSSSSPFKDCCRTAGERWIWTWAGVGTSNPSFYSQH